MSDANLKDRIEALSKALRDGEKIDAAARAALGALQREIDAVLHRQDELSLKERLEQLAVRFENQHPAAGTALRQAIDALAKAGM